MLKFTKSLDWIDLVLDKIVSEGFNFLLTTINIKRIDPSHRYKVRISSNGEPTYMFDGGANTRLEAIVEAVVQYIQWDNANQGK